jgi:hypothetical protein
MAITIYGGTTIQPLEANVSASQQQTTFVFLSSDSGSYIYSGSNPNLIASGSPLPHHTSSLTFEDSGSTYSFVFSGSGFGGSPSSSLPGTTLSASIDGLTNSGSIAAAFTASVVAATNMTASIVSGSIVTLINSAYSSSATTTSSFSPNTLFTYTSQSGHPSGYLSGSDTTGSLTVNGGFEVQGNEPINIATIKGGSPPTVNIGNDLLAINTNTNYVIITGSSRLAFSSGSPNDSAKSSGVATLVGGNCLITASNASTSYLFMQRISGSNANPGHLNFSASSNNSFTISSSNTSDSGSFAYFIIQNVS